jgi:hypothetical protein
MAQAEAQRHVQQHIQNKIVTNKCPRCRVAFVYAPLRWLPCYHLPSEDVQMRIPASRTHVAGFQVYLPGLEKDAHVRYYEGCLLRDSRANLRTVDAASVKKAIFFIHETELEWSLAAPIDSDMSQCSTVCAVVYVCVCV